MKILSGRQPRRKSRRHVGDKIDRGRCTYTCSQPRPSIWESGPLRRTTLRGVVDKSPMVVIKGPRESSIEDKEETGKERFYTRNYDDDNHHDNHDDDDDDGDDNAKVNKDRRLHNGQHDFPFNPG